MRVLWPMLLALAAACVELDPWKMPIDAMSAGDVPGGIPPGWVIDPVETRAIVDGYRCWTGETHCSHRALALTRTTPCTASDEADLLARRIVAALPAGARLEVDGEAGLEHSILFIEPERRLMAAVRREKGDICANWIAYGSRTCVTSTRAAEKWRSFAAGLVRAARRVAGFK